jgi:phosphoglycolate phosphatase-like HAD superfamily hydrolase
MDGTLLDGRKAIVAAVAEGLLATYRHFHLQPPSIEEPRIAAAIGLPTPYFFRAAYDENTVFAELRDRFVAEFEIRSTRAEVAALQRGEAHLYEGAEETLQSLVDRGHPLALFSNANDPYFSAVVNAHRLDRFFSNALSLENAVRQRLARNKAGIVKHLVRKFPHAVVVGDRIHDVEAGISAGARTVGCLFGFGRPEELQFADWTIKSLPEILDLPLALARGGHDSGTSQRIKDADASAAS